MPKTKDGFIIDDEPVTKPMTRKEVLEYIDRLLKEPDTKSKQKPKKNPNA